MSMTPGPASPFESTAGGPATRSSNGNGATGNGHAAVDLATAAPDLQTLALVPRAVAERLRLVPVERRGDVLVVAMADPGDVHTIDDVARMAGCRICPRRCG